MALVVAATPHPMLPAPVLLQADPWAMPQHDGTVYPHKPLLTCVVVGVDDPLLRHLDAPLRQLQDGLVQRAGGAGLGVGQGEQGCGLRVRDWRQGLLLKELASSSVPAERAWVWVKGAGGKGGVWVKGGGFG